MYIFITIVLSLIDLQITKKIEKNIFLKLGLE
jgi:hypothetical protein